MLVTKQLMGWVQIQITCFSKWGQSPSKLGEQQVHSTNCESMPVCYLCSNKLSHLTVPHIAIMKLIYTSCYITYVLISYHYADVFM